MTTPMEKKLLEFIPAAAELGLRAAIVIPRDAPPCSVDIQLVRGGRVRAAMRVIAWDKAWRVELPMRTGVEELYNGRLVYLADLDEEISAGTLKRLDHWFSQVPDSGRPPTPKPAVEAGKNTPGWMKIGNWEPINRTVSAPH